MKSLIGVMPQLLEWWGQACDCEFVLVVGIEVLIHIDIIHFSIRNHEPDLTIPRAEA